MNRLTKAGLLGGVIAGLGGCAQPLFPGAVRMPTAAAQKVPPAEDLGPFLGVSNKVYEIGKLDDQLDTFVGTWRKAEHDLVTQTDGLDLFQFTSMVWAAYKTATGDLHDAKWGIAGAGGAGLLEGKLQVFNQSLAYSNGADAMECVKQHIDIFPASFWTTFFNPADGSFKYADKVSAYVQATPKDAGLAGSQNATPNTDASVRQEQVAQGMEALQGVFTTVYDHMNTISHRVRKDLESTRINVPNSTDITTAISGSAAAQQTAGVNAAAVKDVGKPAAPAPAAAPLDVANAELKVMQTHDLAVAANAKASGKAAAPAAVAAASSANAAFEQALTEYRQKLRPVAPPAPPAPPQDLANAVKGFSQSLMSKSFSLAKDLDGCTALVPAN